MTPRVTVAEHEPAPVVGDCSVAITRSNLTGCAVAKNPSLLEESARSRAAESRKDGSRAFLPSQPTVSGSLSSRTGQNQRATNWNVALNQELEIAGQSFVRSTVASTEVNAQNQRAASRRIDLLAVAWAAYFRVSAAQERIQLATRLEQATTQVATTVRAMAQKGLTAEVDADVAETAALKATSERLASEGTLASAQAQLDGLMGGDPGRKVVGSLQPLGSTAEIPIEQLPSFVALTEQQKAAQQRVSLLRRERIPNPTLSLFAQNDGFDERVLGLGLSLPIPLPTPLGKSGASAVAEAKALSDVASAEVEQRRRDLQAELFAAKSDFRIATQLTTLYPKERAAKAKARLESLWEQVQAARLAARDALFAQQALVEQLKAEIDAKEALCLASVRLARASGANLEGDSL